MRKPDWIVHAIIPEKNDMPFVRNFHTHGLSKFKHPELMLVLNIPEDIATEILNGLGEKIKKKEQRFEEEGRYLNILANGYKFVAKTHRFACGMKATKLPNSIHSYE